jgi:hypothetical protein
VLLAVVEDRAELVDLVLHRARVQQVVLRRRLAWIRPAFKRIGAKGVLGVLIGVLGVLTMGYSEYSQRYSEYASARQGVLRALTRLASRSKRMHDGCDDLGGPMHAHRSGLNADVFRSCTCLA